MLTSGLAQYRQWSRQCRLSIHFGKLPGQQRKLNTTALLGRVVVGGPADRRGDPGPEYSQRSSLHFAHSEARQDDLVHTPQTIHHHASSCLALAKRSIFSRLLIMGGAISMPPNCLFSIFCFSIPFQLSKSFDSLRCGIQSFRSFLTRVY